MSLNFCKGGRAKVNAFMHLVDDSLISVMTTVTDVTGKIKAIEGYPTVQQIEDIIPNGHVYATVFDNAVDAVAGVVTGALTVAEKIAAALAGKTQDGKDGELLKIASKATAIADGRYKQHTYDTAVQVHLEGLK